MKKEIIKNFKIDDYYVKPIICGCINSLKYGIIGCPRSFRALISKGKGVHLDQIVNEVKEEIIKAEIPYGSRMLSSNATIPSCNGRLVDEKNKVAAFLIAYKIKECCLGDEEAYSKKIIYGLKKDGKIIMGELIKESNGLGDNLTLDKIEKGILYYTYETKRSVSNTKLNLKEI